MDNSITSINKQYRKGINEICNYIKQFRKKKRDQSREESSQF